MRRVRFVAIALVSIFTPYIIDSQEVFAQSSQRSLSGVWTKKGTPFNGNRSGCHVGSGGASGPPPVREITIVQNGNNLSVPGKFVSTSSGYNSGTSGEVRGNQVTLTDSGGGFTVRYTGTISNDGQTITGQTLCRYGSGSATANGSFTWTRKGETKRIKVWLTGFIPDERVDIFKWFPVVGQTPRVPVLDTRCSSGDGRTFSDNLSETRYRFRQLVEFEVEVQNKKVSRVKLIGSPSSNIQPSYLVDCKTGQLFPESKRTASTEGLKFDYGLSESNAITVKFSGKLQNPIIVTAPYIDYKVEATIDPVNETATLGGWRNRFPAYELYMSFRNQNQDEQEARTKPLIQAMPDGWTKTPWDLLDGLPLVRPGRQPIPSPTPSHKEIFNGGDSGGGGSSTLW